jgi:hypothetical protein
MPSVSFELITDDIPFAHECSVSTENWENYTVFIAVISTYYSEMQFCLNWHFLCREWISQRGVCRLGALFVPKIKEMMLKCRLTYLNMLIRTFDCLLPNGQDGFDSSSDIRSSKFIKWIFTSSWTGRDKQYMVHKLKWRPANWIGHILRRNCLLKHVVYVKVERSWRRVRRRKQLLVNPKEKRRCLNLK